MTQTLHAVQTLPKLQPASAPHNSHNPLLWAHNCCADNTASVLLQLAALPHSSGWLSYRLDMAAQCLQYMKVSSYIQLIKQARIH